MRLWQTYHSVTPHFISRIAETAAMQRLKDVGMNCGCEYTSFPLFTGLEPYSRFDHSVGCGLIVWHFTDDVKQSVAALLHDIASPTFAHVVDFMNGDHERQESTENLTREFIASSQELQDCLQELELTTDDVADYHRYPVADNDTPRLSADRLEYTLGNVVNFGICSREQVARWYDDLIVGRNEDDVEELMFRHKATAKEFGFATLKTSSIYVSDEDRYAMQMLALLIQKHIGRGVLTVPDLYTTETEVIRLLNSDHQAQADWQRFCSLRTMSPQNAPYSKPLAIPAKKRHINPCVLNLGRLTAISEPFNQSLKGFLAQDFITPISGE